MSLRVRLEALEARRRAGDGPARAFNALEHMGEPHLAQDPTMASKLRDCRIHYALEAHLTASAVVADLAGAGIVYSLEDAQAALEAYRRSAEAHFAKFRNAPAWPAEN